MIKNLSNQNERNDIEEKISLKENYDTQKTIERILAVIIRQQLQRGA